MPVFTCTKNSDFRILIERINYRLPDLGALSYDTGLYILKQCLSATKLLYNIYGPFHISD